MDSQKRGIGKETETDYSFFSFLLYKLSLHSPTGPFTISEPQNQEISQIYAAQKRRGTDSKSVGRDYGLSSCSHYRHFCKSRSRCVLQ